MTPPAVLADTPVAAASSLKFALPALREAFAAQTGYRLQISYGSSGNLRHQIERGAPHQVFLAANEEHPLALAAQGLTQGNGYGYACGQLALYLPRRGPITADTAFRGVRHWLAQNDSRRFVIANPRHAPYGQAAREVLQHQDLWQPLQGHLILGESATQAARFALTDSVAGGLLPLSLARVEALQQHGHFLALPQQGYRPLRHRMVLLQQSGAGARAFFSFMQGEQARQILSDYGLLSTGCGDEQ